MVGLAVGLTVGLAFGFLIGLIGLAFGLAFGLAAGLTAGSTPKVGLIELALVTTGAGRVNFMQLLEDVHHREVLRQAGAVYQFRHAELQVHLAKIHRQRSHSPITT